LIDGIDPGADLGKFTSFFNPDSGGAFDAKDWAELMTQPPVAAYNTTDAYWDSPNPYPNQRIVWADPNLSNEPGYEEFLFSLIDPRDNTTILDFGIDY
jgi:hypothetical protein